MMLNDLTWWNKSLFFYDTFRPECHRTSLDIIGSHQNSNKFRRKRIFLPSETNLLTFFSTTSKDAKEEKIFGAWNGWPPCSPVSPARANRWPDITASMVMSAEAGGKKDYDTWYPLSSNLNYYQKSTEKLGYIDPKNVRGRALNVSQVPRIDACITHS